MEEEQERDKVFTPPPPLGVKQEENAPSYIMFTIIAVALIMISGAYFILSSPLAKQKEYETTTMICESFDNDVCQRRNDDIFQRGETIIVATMISPMDKEDVDIDLLFTADMVLPNGKLVNDVNEYNVKKTIQKNKFSNYLFELTPRAETAFGEYTIILRLIDNVGGYKEIVEKTFTLYNGAR